MKIAFDIQPLFNHKKSGVGFHEHGLITGLMKAYPDDQFLLEGFTWKNRAEKVKIADTFITSVPSPEEGGRRNVSLDECRRFPGTLYRMLFPFVPIPYRLFFRRKADVTHFFNFCVPPGVFGKTVVTVHDMAFRAYPETIRNKTLLFLRLNLKRTLNRADQIIAVSEFTKTELIRYYHIREEKIAVIPNGVDGTVFRPSYPEAERLAVKEKYGISRPYFLYLGTLEPRKNIERLVEAYALLRQDREASRDGAPLPLLVIAGGKGWRYDTIFQKVEEHRLQETVLFPGYVEEGDVPLLMGGAVAFLFPSLYEGFGMPPLEAMACGTPVVTSDGSALREVAGDACVLVDPGSAQAIKDGIKRLYLNRDLYRACIEKGLERARRYTWERAAAELYFVYREVTGIKE